MPFITQYLTETGRTRIYAEVALGCTQCGGQEWRVSLSRAPEKMSTMEMLRLADAVMCAACGAAGGADTESQEPIG